MMKQPVKIMKHLETTCADAADPGFVTFSWPTLAQVSLPFMHFFASLPFI